MARERTQHRVFGWWLAYPWAFLESTVETVFRGALGTVGTAGGLVSGAAIVPAYHALDSAVAGVWNLGVNTIIIPVVGVTWNTVVGPPLALVGQKPAESRVDGFWVTIVAPGQAAGARKLTQEEIRLLSQWGLLLLKETEPFDQKQRELKRQAAEQEAALRRSIQEQRAAADRQVAVLQGEKMARMQQVLATQDPVATLFRQAVPLAYEDENSAEVRRCLKRMNVADKEIARVLELLRTYQAPRTVAPSPARAKTDPLQRSMDVIGKSAEDALK